MLHPCRQQFNDDKEGTGEFERKYDQSGAEDWKEQVMGALEIIEG